MRLVDGYRNHYTLTVLNGPGANLMASRIGVYDGIRYRSERKLWGLPLVEIAMGPCAAQGERWGKPCAIIAIGDFPIGVVAIGGISLGCFSIGGLAAGVFAMGGLAAGAITSGGLSIGLLLALGGLAIGGIAFGGLAMGGIAIGGVAIGWAAIGGFAGGYYANGGGAVGAYVVSDATVDPVAEAFFRKWFPWSLRNRNVRSSWTAECARDSSDRC